MNRKITRQEKDWLLKGLGTLESGKYFGGGRWIDTKAGKTKPLDKPVDPKFWLNQIDHLRVIDQCDCGEPNCHTVKFQNFESGKSVASVCDSTDDGRMLIIHINEDNGLIAELEMISEKYPVMPNIYLQGTAGAMPPLTRFGRIRSCTSG